MINPLPTNLYSPMKAIFSSIIISLAVPWFASFDQAAAQTPWSTCPDRVWLGADYWANPMEDWQVVNGEAECKIGGGGRNVHLLTHQITDPTKPLEMTIKFRLIESAAAGGGAGFRIGVRSDIGEYRSNCFAPGGIQAGVVDDQLKLGPATQPLADPAAAQEPIRLVLVNEPNEDSEQIVLTLVAYQITDPDSPVELARLTHAFAAENLVGNVAIVNNFAPPGPRNAAKQKPLNRYRFSDWTATGEAFTITPSQAFGPILWSMYSLSDSRGPDGFVMKITALTPPLGDDDNPNVSLEMKPAGQWIAIGAAPLNRDAWTATFRVPNWDQSREIPYRLGYQLRDSSGGQTVSYREGVVRPNPVGRPLRVASLTCQNDYAFPYEPVANNLLMLDPDLLYFSGDQLYENHGGFGIIRSPAEPAILNYLRKYYQFGWAFGEVMRSRPTIVLPDDHDVFQGNIWGEAGMAMDFSIDPGASSRGGYAQPARMVNVVHATCTSHHPDFYDPTPVKQNISVYHGDMVYGGVGFAIIADRQFKSGPERVKTDGPRADHVTSPDFDTATLDKPDLVLLGDRQEQFLKAWSADWRGHTMKVLLSQTLFAGAATHHGGYEGYLKADLDSGGWPQSKRDSALRSLEGSMALHLNGDQHLTSLVQYGIDKQRDSIWSFCSPAIAVGYPRWWRPDELGMPHENRPAHGLANSGEYLDGFGNKMFVYAVGNPEVASKENRYQRAHQKASGFGMVTIDQDAKTYHIEAFRFLVDPTDENPDNQFPGWPVTISQDRQVLSGGTPVINHE